MTLFQIARNRLGREARSFSKAFAYAQGFRPSRKLRRDKSARQEGAAGEGRSHMRALLRRERGDDVLKAASRMPSRRAQSWVEGWWVIFEVREDQKANAQLAYAERLRG